MDKKILNGKVYYYENVIDKFDYFLEILAELDRLDSRN